VAVAEAGLRRACAPDAVRLGVDDIQRWRRSETTATVALPPRVAEAP